MGRALHGVVNRGRPSCLTWSKAGGGGIRVRIYLARGANKYSASAFWLMAYGLVGGTPFLPMLVNANFNSNFSPFTPNATKTLLTSVV